MIDLNADLGELPGDLGLMRVVTSANIACGGHAGDDQTMAEAVRLAADHGVRVGAHPSYLDRAGFGRTERSDPPRLVARQVAEQVEKLGEMTTVTYVKLHGALYHRANRDDELAQAVLDVLPVHSVLAQPGCLLDRAREKGWQAVEEGFCDRAYLEDGSLVDRRVKGAVLTDDAEVVAQAVALAPRFGSLCLHGDTPGAFDLAGKVRRALEMAGFEVGAFA
ncbi:MAG: 5-oxoprolinase subunit PxpA [Acidimicrobiales bacterium]